jgi:hypothetical protein
MVKQKQNAQPALHGAWRRWPYLSVLIIQREVYGPVNRDDTRIESRIFSDLRNDESLPGDVKTRDFYYPVLLGRIGKRITRWYRAMSVRWEALFTRAGSSGRIDMDCESFF